MTATRAVAYRAAGPIDRPDALIDTEIDVPGPRGHDLLNEVSRLVDAGTIATTLTSTLSPLNAATLREAHRQVESSAHIGKLVVTA
ncbi:MAG TPA: zinc-binding dehydrogenase [Trebonia sp.]|jgi:NADPH:quinone reductase-like Zn-dependent oxidoreductase|nr:zinc-binding dehydrogenase [Trebonia sp.]